MNKGSKKLLLDAVESGNIKEVMQAFKKHFVSLDKNYFDLELLKTAFRRGDDSIIKYILYKTPCQADSGHREVRGKDSLLHMAIKMNNNYIIKQLINKGASLFDKDENGDIPILAAFKQKNQVIVQALLTQGKPNCKPDDVDGMIHFHLACITNHTTAAEHFLKCGFSPNNPFILKFEEYSKLNPLAYSVEKNYYPLFQLLLRYGGDLSIKNAKGLTPLHVTYYTCSTKSAVSRIKQIFSIADDTKFINVEDSYRVSHFYFACMINDPNFAEVFINNGVNINISTSVDCPINSGFTPLHFAVTNNCEKVVQLLLKNGADCNKADKDGKTPLHWACSSTDSNREKIIDILLHYKSSSASVDNHGSIPLHTEFCNTLVRNKNVFDRLWKILPSENLINKDGLSLFHIACSTDDVDRVKHFLDSGVKVNDCVSSGIYSGYTALHFAALHNQKDVVKLLLNKKARVNVKTKEFEISPLHLACEFNYAKFSGVDLLKKVKNSESFPTHPDSIVNRQNQLDIIQLLLSHGTCVNVKDNQGITPLLHACMINRNYCKLNWVCLSACNFKPGVKNEISLRLGKIVQLLCSHKAEINVTSDKKETILHILGKYRILKCTDEWIKFIVAKVIDVDCTDDSGSTPLHVAVKGSNFEMVKILLDRKANVNIKCKNSRIPLEGLFSGIDDPWNPTALFRDKQEQLIFSTLLENGSNVNILVGKKNKSLLHVAVDRGNTYMIEKLLSNGADINIEDSLGNSCVSPLLKWRDADNLSNQLGYVKVFEVVYIHVQKLLALGHHVNEKVQKICRKLHPYHTAILSRHDSHYLDVHPINLDKTFRNCGKELDKLKLIKIGDNTSLYSILLKGEHKLHHCVRSDNFQEIISNKKNDFPLYYDFLNLQFRRATIRSALIPQTKEIIFSLTKTFGFHLPDLCCDLIVQYLKNEDFANLIAILPPKKFLKRKLNNNQQTEEKNRQVKKAKKDNVIQ